EQVESHVELDPVNRSLLPERAAFGLPQLPQGEGRAGEVVDGFDARIEREEIQAVGVAGGQPGGNLRPEDVPDTGHVEQPRTYVKYPPELRARADAQLSEESADRTVVGAGVPVTRTAHR